MGVIIGFSYTYLYSSTIRAKALLVCVTLARVVNWGEFRNKPLRQEFYSSTVSYSRKFDCRGMTSK